MKTINLALCAYIAEYIHEEITRGTPLGEIDKYTISQAIEAFEGGASIGADNDD